MTSKPMWDSKSVKAYETGQGVELVNEPYPHYVPSQKKREWVELTNKEMKAIVKAHDVILTGKMWVFIADLIDELKERNT